MPSAPEGAEGQPEALRDEAPERRVESVGGVFAVVNVLDDQPFGGQPGIFTISSSSYAVA